MSSEALDEGSESWRAISRWADLLRLRLSRISVTRLALIAIAAGVIVCLLHRPWSQPVIGDSAIYDYIAQSILRGQLPYRDVVDIKGPASTYLAATAMAIGKLVGIRDILAARLFQGLLLGILAGLTYLLAEINLRNRIAALLAFLFTLMPDRVGTWVASGVEPKLPMILFGMLALSLIHRNRPFLAGVCSMIAALSWQPGLMFVGVAFLMFSKYFTSWRDLRWLRVLLGAALPLSAVVLYFYSHGGLSDLWDWTIVYNSSVFGPDATRPLPEAVLHLARVWVRIYGPDAVLVLLAAAGFVMYGIKRIRSKLHDRTAFQDEQLFRDAILIPPAIYFAFCMINFGAGRDLIPFIPFVGIFAAHFLVEVAGRASAHLHRKGKQWTIAPRWVGAFAVMLILIVIVFRGFTNKPDPASLQEQDRQFSRISTLLRPEDKVYVHGTVELLVLLNRANMNPYVFLDWGADDFAAARQSTDFGQLIQQMDSEQPRLVSLSRLKKVSNRELLERWVAEHYQKLPDFEYADVYVRKE